MQGLPQLPTRAVRYRDLTRSEFDLDAALTRHPAILLVDELAHSNLLAATPAPRHPKRWQDVEELLEAGIDVWTTVNVQHLESLNDLIVQTTGVQQRETLPDHVFDQADEVELIDLPPDDLLARLRAGKIYLQADAAHARGELFPQAQSHGAAGNCVAAGWPTGWRRRRATRRLASGCRMRDWRAIGCWSRRALMRSRSS